MDDTEVELKLLKESVTVLASEAGYNFCFGCYKWGKKGDFYAGICDGCHEWHCDMCSGFDILSYENSDNHLQLCSTCSKEFNTDDLKYVFIRIPVSSDDENFTDIAYQMLDGINDYFSGGPHYQYVVNIIGTKSQVDVYDTDHGLIGFSFDISEDYPDHEINETLEDLVEDLTSYLQENNLI